MTTKDFREKTAALDGLLGVGQCFDMTARDLTIGGRAARLWVVNGYAQEDLLERVIAGWQALPDLNSVTARRTSAGGMCPPAMRRPSRTVTRR